MDCDSGIVYFNYHIYADSNTDAETIRIRSVSINYQITEILDTHGVEIVAHTGNFKYPLCIASFYGNIYEKANSSISHMLYCTWDDISTCTKQ